jgi:hypothetical protein
MSIFIKTSPKLRSLVVPIVTQALAAVKIEDPQQCIESATSMVAEMLPQVEKLTILWGRIVIAVGLMSGLFALAIHFSSTNATASQVLFHCFELTFTAALGLFGIEAARNG